MISNQIFLWEDKNVFIKTYLLENSKELRPGCKRPLIIVCPGGGYAFTSDREAEPVVLAYAAAGYHAVVLRYSVGEQATMPRPLTELADTVAYFREHAEELYINPDQIVVTGFSAGGHLAASLGVFWNHKEMLTKYKDKRELIRPNGMLLCYPVLDLASSTNRLDIGIVGQPELDKIDFNMVRSNMKREDIFVRENGKTYIDFEVAMNAYIFGGYYSKEEEMFFSLQNQVSVDTPPTFLWHAAGDDLILPANSLKFATALNENHIPYELHVFGEGGHGLGLANEITSNNPWENVPSVQIWLSLALTWLKNRFN